ncbi:hypothetical protein [Bradyrhizobium diazoefficiens]|uniref:hypothetical protein n=1 Tax=Bradyrhizobium diazoefficiens TaxID=1355477 RepID=UPI0036F3ED8D
MTMSVEQLWSLPETALVGAYAEARRRYAEKKFERDTQRARLEWMRAKLFVNTQGNVTERKMAVDVSEELARKGQEVREMTRDLDMLKIDVDVIDTMIRLRGAHGAPPGSCRRGGRETGRAGGGVRWLRSAEAACAARSRSRSRVRSIASSTAIARAAAKRPGPRMPAR